MFIDAKIDWKNKRLKLIEVNGLIEEKPIINPYFYVIVPRGFVQFFTKIVSGMDIMLEEDNRIPIVWDGEKYVPSTDHKVFKVIAESPSQVPKLASQLLSLSNKFDVRISAHNVRYIVRNCFDYNIIFLDAIPLYYGFDVNVVNKLSKITTLVIDVEVIDGEPKLVSCYNYQLFTEVEKDNIASFELPKDIDNLVEMLRKATIIAGHNIIGFDIPTLRRCGINIDSNSKVLFDIVYTLNTFSQSFQIGSARSLLDLAIVLRDKAGITDKEIEIKRSSRKILKTKNINEIIKYNINDIIITTKIMNLIFPFVLVLSGYTQIPLSEVSSLSIGLIAEYFMLRYCELQGFIPEYKKIDVNLSGERVWLEMEEKEYRNVLQLDVKMMYPTYVYHNFIDPTLLDMNKNFNRYNGLGILYSAIQRLYKFREFTKKLKKQDKKFETMDLGVKALINALAYGVQGKKSGYSILGNPIVPAKIYYGTRDIQFKLIEYAKEKGYHPIYSDTDSIFIELKNNNNEDYIQKIVKDLNTFLSSYGLELDIENVWDKVYVYKKKNYILRKGNIVLFKGSALHNLKKFYLPECISLHELLKYEDKMERLKYVKDVIYNCEVNELFIRTAQQVWRLVGKEVQSLKRMKEKASTYLKVLTVWNERPLIYLKKVKPYHIYMPHTIPLIKLFIDKGKIIDLHEVNAHDIIECYSLNLEDIRLKTIEGDVLIWDEEVYTVKLLDFNYIVRFGGKEVFIPSHYSVRQYTNVLGTLVKLNGNTYVKTIKIDENVLRDCVFSYVKSLLKEYNLL